MVKNFSLFLALRYLQPKRSFVSVITAISIIGVMLGVGVLLVVIAVMAGFEDEFKKQLLEFEPHIILKPSEQYSSSGADDEGWGEPMDDPDDPFGDLAPVAPPPPDEMMHGADVDSTDVMAGTMNWRDVRADVMSDFPDIVLRCSPFI
ncbi:MAG: hypothetical protein O3C21_19440, partial [Verrucomicrobia bacterium]|nr:hypothetical protein [Verrucomicrobiota bacterium]